MPRLPILAVVLISTGCSGSDDKAEPCSLAHRSGTFVAHFTERDGGTCGKLTDSVVQLTSATGLPDACAFDAPDSVSDDSCKLTRSYTCPLDGAPGTASIVAITTEKDGGSSFTGLTTSRVYDGAGMLRCASTYDVTFTKQ